MKYQIDIPQPIKDFKAEIEYRFNCKLLIAGGCVRDLAHGLSPKDYDFFVLNCGNDEILTTISDSRFLIKEGKFFKFYPEYAINNNGKTDDRFSGVVKFNVDDFDVDIIKVKLETGMMPQTPVEVISVFDMSINQFAVDDHGAVITLFDGETVKPARVDFTEGRYRYIKSKFPQYDYSAVEKLFQRFQVSFSIGV